MAEIGDRYLNPLLGSILENKLSEVKLSESILPMRELKAMSKDIPARRPFARSIMASSARHRIIAEVKRISPGTGFCRKDFDPAAIASGYASAGASAISVLTDTRFFGGSLHILATVRKEVSVPVLRKDFIIHPYQVYEAAVYGADAVLVMAVNFKSRSEIEDICGIASDVGIEILFEIHGEEELALLPKIPVSVGINNRDFRSPGLTVDIGVTRKVAPLVKKGGLLVSESGIRDMNVVKELEGAGIDAFLIGSAFMEQADPGKALGDFLAG
ncbi:MAG: indole-3-glycerol phosphate synthase TrpC [Nitrospinota bacterium]|nr:indole-3-glycerol phosphate synthase TrpC [Nitrospinota bacterium]